MVDNSTHKGIVLSSGKETLPHAAIRRKLSNITLSEVSQSQKDKYCMTPLYETLRCQILEADSSTVFAKAGGGGMGSCQSRSLEVEFARRKSSRDPFNTVT